MMKERKIRRGAAALAACALVAQGLASQSAAAVTTAIPLVSGGVAPFSLVTLTAWPSGETLAGETDEGGIDATVDVASMRTSSSGVYSFSPDLTSLGSRYTGADGTVDLELTVDSGNAEQTYDFSAADAAAPAAQFEEIAVAGVRTEGVTFSVANGTINSTISDVPDESISQPATDMTTGASTNSTAGASPAISPAMKPNAVSNPTGGCDNGWTRSTYYADRAEHFLNLYTYGHAPADVTEARSSSHTMGIGVAVTGGGWSASGHTDREIGTDLAGHKQYGGSYALYNKVNYRHFMKKCYDIHGNFYKHEVKPVSFAAMESVTLQRSLGALPSSYNHCELMRDQDITKSKGSNVTDSVGVSAPFLDLSAKASYSASTTVTWNFDSTDSYLCGSGGKPYGSAPTAGAKNTSGGCSGCTAVTPAAASRTATSGRVFR